MLPIKGIISKMKTIKSILIESRQMGRFASAKEKGKRSKPEEQKVAPYSNIFFKYPFKGWKFEATIHAAAQEYDRRPDMLEDDWKDFHSRVFDKLEKMKPINGVFVFFSKKYQQSYIAAVNFETKTVKIITVLPKGKSDPRQSGPSKAPTIRMIIEGQQYDLEMIECE